jgi:hypothetical protein
MPKALEALNVGIKLGDGDEFTERREIPKAHSHGFWLMRKFCKGGSF